MSKRVICRRPLETSTLGDLQGVLTKLIQDARMASSPATFTGAHTIFVQDDNGWSVTGVELIEETLSDRSKVYNVRLLFEAFADPAALSALDTQVRQDQTTKKRNR